MHHRQRSFHWSRHERPFQRGDFKYIILQHLKDTPSYGYEIIRALEQRFHGFYAPSPGIVYPTLQMLEEMGYIAAAEQEGKKVYTITEEGKNFLAERRELANKLKKNINRWCNPENTEDLSETMQEFTRLVQLFRDKARTADTKKLEHMRNIISHAYEEISKD
jgi:DNA-binding PadR family transcriptional regulator